MDAVRETPPKRHRLNGTGPGLGTASSPHLLDDDPVEDDYETVATIPLDGHVDQGRMLNAQTGGSKGTAHLGDARVRHAGENGYHLGDRRNGSDADAPASPAFSRRFIYRDDLPSSSGLHSYPLPPNLQPPTQPTQLVHTPSEDEDEVQVLASSPANAMRAHQSSRNGQGNTNDSDHLKRTNGFNHNSKLLELQRQQKEREEDLRRNRQKPSAPGRLALSMAPAGTAFRAPNVQRAPARAEPVVIDSDDEAMPYVGASSGDDDGVKNIKPTEPKLRRGPNASEQSKRPNSDTHSKYWANGDAPKSLALLPERSKTLRDDNGEYYRIPKRRKVAERPKTLDEIEDFQLRSKITRMRDILPTFRIGILYETLLQKGSNADDAVEYLMSKDPQELNLTSPEPDYLASSPTLEKPKPKMRAKQKLAEPVKSLQERYVKKPSETQRPRRRLVQGLKPRPPSESSSAASTPPDTPQPTSPAVEEIEYEEDSDSGVAADTNDLVSFFNTCTVSELMDLASVTTTEAELVLSHRPFTSTKQVRKIDDPNSASNKRKRVVMGERVVDEAVQMWNGYITVDKLVAQCEKISKDVRNEMSKWGVDIFGASKRGELGLMSWNVTGQTPATDSGVATPNTGPPSGSEATAADKPSKVATRDTPSSLRFFPQPKLMNEDVVLKEYQVVGVNWLDLLFRCGLSGILADDMGLGKTCQVIAFFARLKELNIKGPHVVIVPTSTLENWMREFEAFCSDLTVFPYHGAQKERWGAMQVEIERTKPNVVVTTYSMAKIQEDRHFLKKLNPVVCVFDEAHMLKNPFSNAYDQLLNIKCDFRLMLTGTPLQNNLKELIALLGFLLPKVFQAHLDDLREIFHHQAKTVSSANDGSEAASHASLLSETRISKAKAMLAPFVLRRRKAQVLKMLPPKTQRIQYCEMTAAQAEFYRSEYARLKELANAPTKKAKDRENVLMVLRKAAIHPWLFRREYTDDIIGEMARAIVHKFPHKDENYLFEDLSVLTDSQIDAMMAEDQEYAQTLAPFRVAGTGFMDSGKVTALLGLLSDYAGQEARTLVFSQFTQVLDILERVFQEVGIKFVRLDGSTPIVERQPLLDLFYEDLSIPVFLLSTKAGGAGINLAAANRVVIFDASFNPQDDVQAENRAHRVGQTKPVEVVRLVTKGTIEEKILALGKTKLALGARVAGEAGEDDAAAAAATTKGSELEPGTADKNVPTITSSGDDEDEESYAANTKRAAALEKAGRQKVLQMLLDGATDEE